MSTHAHVINTCNMQYTEDIPTPLELCQPLR